MERWLITGSSGFLGANAGLALRGAAFRVGTARRVKGSPAFDELHPLDLLDSASTVDLVRRTRPDVILNCAALASHEDCADDHELAHRINADAAASLARAAVEVDAQLVHISTDAVFDGRTGWYAETDDPHPFSIYGESKLAGEVSVLEAYPSALVIRTNFFGWSPDRKRSILEFFVTALREGRPVQGYVDTIVTSSYAPDLVSVVRELLGVGATGIVHVASRDALSKYAFGMAVAAEFSLDATLIEPIEAATSGRPSATARDISLDTTLATRLIGHDLRSQAEGLAEARRVEATLGAELASAAS